jgi:ABC-type polysaccharide/polyol phosphate transport system ATPase subunit
VNAGVAASGLGVHFFFDRQNRVVTPTLARLRRRGSDSWGVRDLTFAVGAGEGVALIGANGAGKSTLLRAIAGVFPADAGRVEAHGRIAALLSIDGGLMPTLTGRENCILLGVLAGLTRREAGARVGEIRERTGLEREFDHPVSSYSQGMRARLGFAVAEEIDPDVLLLDEVHEAVDHEFRAIVEERALAVLRRGGIVMAAGHDHGLLKRLCSRAILLSSGTLAADADFDSALQAYVEPQSDTRGPK